MLFTKFSAVLIISLSLSAVASPEICIGDEICIGLDGKVRPGGSRRNQGGQLPVQNPVPGDQYGHDEYEEGKDQFGIGTRDDRYGHGGRGGRPGRGGGRGNGGGYYPPNPYEPAPHHPLPPPQQDYYDTSVQTIYVGRATRNETFHLRQLAGLDRAFSGYEVVSVRARTSPNSPGTTTVQLVADGRIIAQQVNPGRQINLFPRGAILDRNIRSLQMVVLGSTVIVENIEIELRAYRQ